MTAGDGTTITTTETGQAHQRLPQLSGSIVLGKTASGEIRLIEACAEADLRADFLLRQQRALEWIALKAWWGACRSLKRANDTGKTKRIVEAHRQRQKVIDLYGPALHRARAKWRRARKEYEYRRRHPTTKSIEITDELPGASGF